MAPAGDFAAWFTEEDNHQQAHDVEGRQKRREQTHAEDWHVTFVGERQNRILAKKSAKRRTTDQCQRANNEGEKCDREISGKASHFPDVLLVMEHHDDGASGEEEERFKKRVGKKVEHGRVI